MYLNGDVKRQWREALLCIPYISQHAIYYGMYLLYVLNITSQYLQWLNKHLILGLTYSDLVRLAVIVSFNKTIVFPSPPPPPPHRFSTVLSTLNSAKYISVTITKNGAEFQLTCFCITISKNRFDSEKNMTHCHL